MSEWKSCAQFVYRGNWARKFPCAKPASIEENGKWWCRQHAPSLVAERIEKRNAEWRRKREAERAAASRKDAIASAERAVIEAAVEEAVWRRQIDLQRPDIIACTLDGLVRAEQEVLVAVDALIAAREGR